MAFDLLYQSTPTYSISYAKAILGTGDVNENTGHIDQGCELKGLGFPQQIHGALRRIDDYPPTTARAYVLRQIAGKHSWAGTHGHSYMEDVMYHMMDLRKNPLLEPRFAEIKAERIALMRSEWTESEDYDFQSALLKLIARRSGDPRILWIKDHADKLLAGQAINYNENSLSNQIKTSQELFENIIDWLRPTLDYMPEHVSEMIEGADISDWFLLEGKRLIDGQLVAPNGETQEELRKKRSQPSFDMDVDGEKVRIYCTLDFAYQTKKGLTIADLKTGKLKAETYLDQLYLYALAVMELYPNHFEPEQISFRLMFPSAPEGSKYINETFDSNKLKLVREKTKEDIRKILGTYSGLGSPETITRQALQSYVDTFPKKDAYALWTLGKFFHEKRWPKSMPQVRNPYPLEMHRDFTPETFVPQVPTKQEVTDYLLTYLSPNEFAKGLVREDRKFEYEKRIERIIEHRISTNQKTDNIYINNIIAEELLPSKGADDILKAFNPSHLRMKLTFNTPANGADEVPEHCPGCHFFSICDAGQIANTKFEERKKIDWTSFTARLDNMLNIKISERQLIQFKLYHEKLADFIEQHTTFDFKEHDLLSANYFNALTLSKFINLNPLSSCVDTSSDDFFPSISLKIAFPHLNMVYVSTDIRKIEFAAKMSQRLELENFNVYHLKNSFTRLPAFLQESADIIITDESKKPKIYSTLLESAVGQSTVCAVIKKLDTEDNFEKINQIFPSSDFRIDKVENYSLPEHQGGRAVILLNRVD